MAYLFLPSPLPLHAMVLLAKVLVVGANPRQRRALSPPQANALFALVALVATSLVLEIGTDRFLYTEYVGYAAFAISICLSWSLLANRNAIRRYSSAFVLIPSVVAMIHIWLATTHRLPTHFGRASYVGGAHPNLAGEIAAAMALCASLGSGSRWKYAVFAVAAWSALLSEARAALAAVLLITLVTFAREVRELVGSRLPALAGITAMGAVVLLSVWTMGPEIQEVSSREVLLLDDPHRGLGSGFVGRSSTWRSAISAWADQPLVGQGVSYSPAGDQGAHNALLASLAKHGILSILFWAPVVHEFVRLLTRRMYPVALCLMAMSPLVLFNDRFINLNPYPFVMYVLLFAVARKSAKPDLESSWRGVRE